MGIISSEERKNLAMDKSLRQTIKDSYPNDWKKIIKCIEDNIDAGLENQALEDAIETCLQGISAVSDTAREHLKKAPRSHIHVGG